MRILLSALLLLLVAVQVEGVDFFLGNSSVVAMKGDAPHYAAHPTDGKGFDITTNLYFMSRTELAECTLKESAKDAILFIKQSIRLCESHDIYPECVRRGCAGLI